VLSRTYQHPLARGRSGGTIVVALIADETIGATPAIAEQAGVIGGLPSEREQPVVGQAGAGDRAGRARNPHVRDGVTPVAGLAVEVGQVGVAQPHPEIAADVLDPIPDLALRLGPVGAAGPRREAVVVDARSSTAVLRLSCSTWRGAPPKERQAWRWQRRNQVLSTEVVNAW
jgi:hypothetical protein